MYPLKDRLRRSFRLPGGRSETGVSGGRLPGRSANQRVDLSRVWVHRPVWQAPAPSLSARNAWRLPPLWREHTRPKPGVASASPQSKPRSGRSEETPTVLTNPVSRWVRHIRPAPTSPRVLPVMLHHGPPEVRGVTVAEADGTHEDKRLAKDELGYHPRRFHRVQALELEHLVVDPRRHR